MFLPKPLAHQISSIFYMTDINCRFDLHTKVLVSERDYVTSFTTRLRDQFNSSSAVFIHTQTVISTIEQKLGSDAIIIIKYKKYFKIAFFESKWPMIIKNPNYGWDYIKNGASHLTTQLKKQNKYCSDFAFWETFFFEGQGGYDSPPFDALGSSVVLNDDALTYAMDNCLEVSTWKNHHLRSLLRYRGKNIQQVMMLFLTCKTGKKHMQKVQISASGNPYLIEGNYTRLEIPFPVIEETQITEDNFVPINDFMIQNSLSSYIFIDADKIVSSTIQLESEQ